MWGCFIWSSKGRMRGGRHRTCEYLGDVGWPAQGTFTETVLADLNEQPIHCVWLMFAVKCTPCGTAVRA